MRPPAPGHVRAAPGFDRVENHVLLEHLVVGERGGTRVEDVDPTGPAGYARAEITKGRRRALEDKDRSTGDGEELFAFLELTAAGWYGGDHADIGLSHGRNQRERLRGPKARGATGDNDRGKRTLFHRRQNR